MKTQFLHTRNFFKEYVPVNDEQTLFEVKLNLSSKGGTSVAMESLQDWHFRELKLGDFFEKKVGISKCSDDDAFNRKTGRELALSRMKTTTLTVVSLTEDFTGRVIVLQDKKGNKFHLQVGPKGFNRVELFFFEEA